MGHDIRGYGPPVNSVDPVPVPGIQDAVFITQIPDFADLALYAGPAEAVCKFIKLPDRRVLQKIHQGDMGLFFFLIISVVERQEGLHPGIEQFKRHQIKSLLHGLMGRIMDQGFPHFQISEHGRRTVRIDLTETEFAAVLIIEQIKTGNGKLSFIRSRQKNQLLQLPGKGKEFPVFRIPSVSCNDFLENPDGNLRDLPEPCHRFGIIDLGDLQCLVQYALVVQRRQLHHFLHQ